MLSLKEFYPRHIGLGCITPEGFYLYIPKCASTSVKRTAKESEVYLQDYKGDYTYTYIRNPYTRIVSSYCECRRRNKIDKIPLGEFLRSLEDIKDVHIYPQSDFIGDFKLDQIRILEHWVLEHRERVSTNKDILLNEVMYNRNTRYLIEKIYNKDIELYERSIYNSVS